MARALLFLGPRSLTHTLITDGHVDLAIALRFLYGNRIDNAGFLESFRNGTSPGQVDLHRLRQGQAGGAFWSVFAPCPEDALSEEQLAPSKLHIKRHISVALT